MRIFSNLLIGSIVMFFCQQIYAAEVSKSIHGIHNISINTGGTVVLQQGNHDSLRIDADKALLPHVKAETSGNSLNLGLKGYFYSDERPDVTYYITLKNIRKIDARNSAVVKIKTPLQVKSLALSAQSSASISAEDIDASDSLAVSLKSSGQIELGKLHARAIAVSLTSSGTIEIESLVAHKLASSLKNSGTISIDDGQVKEAAINVENSGTYSASAVKVQLADVRVVNSGSAYVNVDKAISITLSGSGSLYLKGKPRLNEVSVSGAGKIYQS